MLYRGASKVGIAVSADCSAVSHGSYGSRFYPTHYIDYWGYARHSIEVFVCFLFVYLAQKIDNDSACRYKYITGIALSLASGQSL